MRDIHPDDIDPDTGRPYPGYSSPSLDTSSHDREMAVEDDEPDVLQALEYAKNHVLNPGSTDTADLLRVLTAAIAKAKVR